MACKKYTGTVFTNKDGNIINEQNDMNNMEIALVNNYSLK